MPLRISKGNGDGRRWTTTEQTAWLVDQKTAYANAKAKGNRGLHVFWVKLFNDWFARWPETAAPSSLNPQADGTEAPPATGEDIEKVEKVKSVCAYCCSVASKLIILWL